VKVSQLNFFAQIIYANKKNPLEVSPAKDGEGFTTTEESETTVATVSLFPL
jgi:hypothetical protein